MHQRFIDFEGSVVEADNHEGDGDSIRLRSSRRIGLPQPNPLFGLGQSISDHISKLSASLERNDDVFLLSTLTSMVKLTKSSDDDEIVTVFLEENVIDKLLGIVSSHDDGAILKPVYSLLALLTCVSAAVVSKIMVPDFLWKSLSKISLADDALALSVLNMLYNSAITGDDYCAFEVGCDVTAHLLRYLFTCQPSTVVRNEKSCCGKLELAESRKQTIETCLLLLTALIKESFPEALKEEVVAACVPYFVSSDREIQLLALKYARHFVSKSKMETFLQFSLPNNQMDASDQTRIPVLSYLVDLLREKQVDYEQNVRAFHVLRRVCADIRDQLKQQEGWPQSEPTCLRTVESDVMAIFRNCLKTIGSVLVIFGEIAYLSEELEQIVIDSGFYPSLGRLLDWSIIVTSDGTPPPTMSAGDDYEYFRTAVETDSELEEPFDVLEPIKTAFRQHSWRRPLAYRDSLRKFVLHDTVDHTLFMPDVLALINAQYSLMKNVLFIVGNAFGGTPAHAEIALFSLFPGFPATEATRKVIVTLQTFFSRLPLKLMKDLMRCVYVLADLPPEHQLVLVESELLQFVWGRRRDLKSGTASFLVDSFILLLQPNDESSPAVARALLERIGNESFASDLDQMCNHRLPDIRECYERLRTFLETISKDCLFTVPSLPVNRSST